MTKTIAAIALAAALALTGCATVTDPVTGETKLTPAGQVIGALLLAGVAISVAAALGSDDSPDRTYVTTYRDGTQSKTEVYDR